MKFDAIVDHVRGVPFIRPANAKYLYELVIRERLTHILELGIAHGTATCYLAAALEELGDGRITSVDLVEAKEMFSPSPEEQLAQSGLSRFVDIVRMQTGYTWFLHDEIKRLTNGNVCTQKYDLCIIDGPKNWTIDGLAFFLVDKILKDSGLIIFDDYNWTYAEADTRRSSTDGITHRALSEEERATPHVKDIFELLVKQHPDYSELHRYPESDWAVARKRQSARQKEYTIHHREERPSALVNAVVRLKDRLMRA